MSQQLKHPDRRDGHDGRSGHGLVMMLSCVPLVVLAIALVATGIAAAGFILAAIMCLAMMAMMMVMMARGGQG
jgi:hypothetical protein